jgi:alginate O-acetyltransferase complex protein AlgI
MVFASTVFLYYFLPIFLAVYYLCRGRLVRLLWITFASYVFYGWWRPDFVTLMWVSTFVDYACGQGIVRARARGRRGRLWIWVTVLCNLGLLAYFKYANFGIDTLNAILASAGVAPIAWTKVILPAGISFYTFKTMSYTIDVYRGTAAPVRTFADYLCFVAMFPDLVAGPIVRYHLVAEQLQSRTHTTSKFYRGVLFFQAGLAKKVLIADTLAPLADAAFAAPAPTTLQAWLGTLAYTFQIYFDFSGYSDMAIGLGRFLGFRFPINFDQPYRSTSITDFWRRWHISLSTFLRDYLYVPLGGNRKGTGRTYVNLALTMLLGGLWHGAAWTFIVWGAYQGLWLVIERLLGKRELLHFAPRPFQIALTFVLAMIGWVFFRAPGIEAAGTHLAAMFGSSASASFPFFLDVRALHWVVFSAAALIVWLLPTTQRLAHDARWTWVAPLQLLFLLALVQLHNQEHVPFLYFQF